MSNTTSVRTSQTSELSVPGSYPELQKRVFCGTSPPVLHQVCLFVPDAEHSVRFYTEDIGLTVKETFGDITGLRQNGHFTFGVSGVFIHAGEGRYIELPPSGDGETQPPGFPLNHLAIGMVDVDSACQTALNAGCNPFGFSMQETHWDGTPLDVIMAGEHSEPMCMAFLKGPGGESVELYQTPIKALENRPHQGA